ncbi:MAG: GntR family transcriptional regulator [Pseudonocardiaceae bacterium]
MVDKFSEDEDKRPASRRVADELRSQIASGRYPAGSALPPYRQLAAEYDVAVNTAMAAVHSLRDEGLVVSKPNAASYVLDRPNQADTEHELRVLRVELGQVRGRLRHLGTNLTEIDDRLTDAMTRLRALGG